MRGGKRPGTGRLSGWGAGVRTVAVRIPEQFLPKIEELKAKCFETKKLTWGETSVPSEFWDNLKGLEKQLGSQKAVEQRLVKANSTLVEENAFLRKKVEELSNRPEPHALEQESVEPIKHLIESLAQYVLELEGEIGEVKNKLELAREAGKTTLESLEEVEEKYNQLVARLEEESEF